MKKYRLYESNPHLPLTYLPTHMLCHRLVQVPRSLIILDRELRKHQGYRYYSARIKDEKRGVIVKTFEGHDKVEVSTNFNNITTTCYLTLISSALDPDCKSLSARVVRWSPDAHIC
jgi:hypothetical protein